MILVRRGGHRVDLGGGDGEVQQPLVDEARIALRGGDGDLVAVGQPSRGVPGADHGGDPQLAGDDRGVAGAAATVGDDGAGALHDRLPVGIGHVRDQHLAGLELVHAVDGVQHPHRAGADLRADRPALRAHVSAGGQDVLLHRVPGAGLHGLGAGLEDVQAAVGAVQAPLDVHRPPVVLLDDQRLAGEVLDLLVGQGQDRLLGGVDGDELGGAADGGVLGVDHLGGLLADGSLEDRGSAGAQAGLVHVELVGVDRTLDHAFAEPVGGGDEHGLVEAGLGVDGEHDAAGAEVGADHLLHPGGERDRGVLEVVVDAVGDRAVVVQRGEHLTDRGEHRVDAAHVQEGLLLPGEGGVGQILRGRRGAHGEGGLLPAAGGELLVGGADVRLELRGERLGDDHLPDLAAGLGQRDRVLGVQALQPGVDPLGQPGAGEELAIGLRGGGEAVGHLHPQSGQVRDHLAEGGVLASHLLEVRHTELGERADALRHGVLLHSACGVVPRRASDWRMRVDISSTDLLEESTKGIPCMS